jgi:hypothetical protein
MKKKSDVIKMSDELFIQRRRIITMLYEAKAVLNMSLPRIKVRIVDYEKHDTYKILGRCFIDKDYITISKDMTNWTDDFLRSVVWHELAHAYFNAKHDMTCPLMHPHCMEAKNKETLALALKRISKRSNHEKLNCIAPTLQQCLRYRMVLPERGK